jgi:AcrR family transcriptional regulator
VSTTGKRIRRTPEQAEAEILHAAEEILRDAGIRGLSVSNVMNLTDMKRAAFYHYFEDRGDLIVGLLGRIEKEMMEASRGWLLDGGGGPGPLREALTGAIGIYRRHGHVLAAAETASFDDENVERAWRDGIVENFITAVTARIVVENESGRATVADPANTARALVLMNTRLLNEDFGRRGVPREIPPEDVIVAIWQRTIYGDFGQERALAGT